jgi:hypothetical protein
LFFGSITEYNFSIDYKKKFDKEKNKRKKKRNVKRLNERENEDKKAKRLRLRWKSGKNNKPSKKQKEFVE